jgi:FixJ family two-component response regulator
MSVSLTPTRLASGREGVTDAIDKPMDVCALLDCIKKYLQQQR